MRIFRQPRDSNMFHEFYNSTTKVDELRRLLMSFKQTRNKGECWVRKIYCNCWWYLMFILYFSEKEGKSEKNAWKSHITVDRVGIHKLNCCQLHHRSIFFLTHLWNKPAMFRFFFPILPILERYSTKNGVFDTFGNMATFDLIYLWAIKPGVFKKIPSSF